MAAATNITHDGEFGSVKKGVAVLDRSRMLGFSRPKIYTERKDTARGEGRDIKCPHRTIMRYVFSFCFSQRHITSPFLTSAWKVIIFLSHRGRGDSYRFPSKWETRFCGGSDGGSEGRKG